MRTAGVTATDTASPRLAAPRPGVSRVERQDPCQIGPDPTLILTLGVEATPGCTQPT